MLWWNLFLMMYHTITGFCIFSRIIFPVSYWRFRWARLYNIFCVKENCCCGTSVFITSVRAGLLDTILLLLFESPETTVAFQVMYSIIFCRISTINTFLLWPLMRVIQNYYSPILTEDTHCYPVILFSFLLSLMNIQKFLLSTLLFLNTCQCSRHKISSSY